MRDHPAGLEDPRAFAPWPYPLLCLAWRLGWGGRCLIAPRKADRVEEPSDAGSALDEAEMTAGLGTARLSRREADRDAHGSWSDAGQRRTTTDRVWAVLQSSP